LNTLIAKNHQITPFLSFDNIAVIGESVRIDLANQFQHFSFHCNIVKGKEGVC
jgi:hypothetical protein